MYSARRDLAAAERAYRLKSRSILQARRIRQPGHHVAQGEPNPRRETSADEITRRFPESSDANALDVLVSYAEGRHDRMREILRPMMASTGQNRIARIQFGAISTFSRGGSRPRSAHAGEGFVASDGAADAARASLGPIAGEVTGCSIVRIRLSAARRVRRWRSVLALRSRGGGVLRTVRPARLGACVVGGARRRRIRPCIQQRHGHVAGVGVDRSRGRQAARRGAPSSARVCVSRAERAFADRWDAETGLAFERAGLPDSAIASYEHYLNAAPVWDLDVSKLAWVLDHVAALYEKKGRPWQGECGVRALGRDLEGRGPGAPAEGEPRSRARRRASLKLITGRPPGYEDARARRRSAGLAWPPGC